MATPKLRFKEFDTSWKRKSLGDITSKIGSGSTPRGGSKAYTEDGVIFIRSQNVNNNQLILENIVYIPQETHIKMSGSKVVANDILLNITGASIGRSCVVPSNFNEGNVNQHVCIIRSQSHDPLFIQSFLSSKKGQNAIQSKQTGSGREGINFQAIRSIDFDLPTKEEQTKIATFLSAVDTKIDELTQKHELLSEYKKGMMQQLFSQKIRFKADDGSDFEDWKERILGNVCTTFSGGTPTSSNTAFYEGSIPFIKSGEIAQESTAQFINKSALDNSSAKLVEKGDLLYALYGATSGQVAISQIEGAINQAVLCIRSETLDTNYLHNYLVFRKQKIISTYLQGGQGNLSASILKKISIPNPSFKEQTKIANFLTAIDQKIDNVAEQID
ncbi:restriction endonuclease subunit S, partial [Psychrobacter sp. 1Y4]|uniref:restriction endonuclease subunit S n=1 Tax=Psychrobacter sp. 1Y4 TaxID=3453575 RepID=UPI003F47A2AA